MIKIDVREKRGRAKDLALTPEERERLYKNLKDPEDRIIFLTSCWAGLRVEEIAQCRFSWLEKTSFGEFEVLKIKIPIEDKSNRKVYKKDGSRVYAKFKPKKEWKTAIYVFDNKIMNEIWFYYQNNQEGLKMSRQNITQYRVCGRTHKGDWMHAHISAILGRKVTTHALRSTFINYMIDEFRFPGNVEPKMTFIKTQLRNKDFRTTMAHYKTETIAQQEAYLNTMLN